MKKPSRNIKPLTLTTTTVARLVASPDLALVAGGSVTVWRIGRTLFSGGFSCNGQC